MGTLHKDLCTFMITSRSIILNIRNVSDKVCRENRSTYSVFNNFSENPAVYETTRKHVYVRAREATDDNALRKKKPSAQGSCR